MPGTRSICAMTSSEPAIGGIAAGETNAAASMRRRPVCESASISRTRWSTSTGCSFWSPSRGPTSRISTLAGQSVIRTGYVEAPPRLRAAVRSLVAASHPQLDWRGTEIERLPQLALEVAQVLGRQRARAEQRERRRVGRALRGVEDARAVL